MTAVGIDNDPPCSTDGCVGKTTHTLFWMIPCPDGPPGNQQARFSQNFCDICAQLAKGLLSSLPAGTKEGDTYGDALRERAGKSSVTRAISTWDSNRKKKPN